jgi:uncharacterized protein (TIGR03067 family)
MLSVALALGLTISVHAQAPTGATTKTELEGGWVGEWSQVSGGPRRPLEPGSVLLVFNGDMIIASGLLPRSDAILRFSLNTQAAPKQIDYWEFWEPGKPKFQGKKILAVYELEGDELRLAIPQCDDGGPFPDLGRNDSSLRRPARVSGDQPCSMLLLLKRH